jgi:transposase
MIDPSVAAEIQRLYVTEGWAIGTIARQFRVHHAAVARIINDPREARVQQVRPTLIDTHRRFIEETLDRWPDLTSRRLFDMCVERGYSGGADHFRTLVRRIRPERRRVPEAFLELRTHPGEQGQVDWGHFGHVAVGRARRPLLAFVMVLSWCRMVFVRFFLGGAMPSFLRGHVEAFEFFGGAPRTILYDNLKSAVLERDGQAIRFHPTLLALAQHYRFQPRPVGVRRGNEKGRVERVIRFLRDSFFAGRTWRGLDDLNAQAREWCLGRAAQRLWRDDQSRKVADAFEEEQPKLLTLPGDRFPADEVLAVRIQKTPYARFDGNDYSVPHEHVKSTLTIAASEREVRILDGTSLLARHERCYDKGAKIESEEHIAALRKLKQQARHGQTGNRVRTAAPTVGKLIDELASRRNNLGSIIAHFARLLDRCGGARLEKAAREALERGTPHPRSVQLLLDADELARGERPPIDVELPPDPRVHGLTVRTHDLHAYDVLRGASFDLPEPEIGFEWADSSICDEEVTRDGQ